jgi:16S rRNA (uracil1498-N3)-methyltransferase
MDEVGFASDEPAVAHVLVDALTTELRIAGTDGHHLARARRLRVGEVVTAADGSGTWRAYVVATVAGSEVHLEATRPARREPALVPGLTVAFALTKGAKPEIVVRQLTELGVDAMAPVLAARSVARSDGPREAKLVDRLERVAREAAMQCRRARLPEVVPPIALTELVGRPGLVLAERGDPGTPSVADPGPPGWTLLVGPEGGLDAAELEALGAVPRLAAGVHVLRAETAAVAAAALLTARRRPSAPPP